MVWFGRNFLTLHTKENGMFESLKKLFGVVDTSDPRETGGHLCGDSKCPRCAPIVKKLEKEHHKDRIDLLRGKNTGKWNDGDI